MNQLKRLGVSITITAVAGMMQAISPAQAITFAPPNAGAVSAETEKQFFGNIESNLGGVFASSEVAPGRLEVTFSGKRLGSRDRVERFLLYRAALLAKENGANWFGLLYLPGEAGPDSHPARSSRSGQNHFGHWQPHWNYYVSGLGWQPWYPEWGVAFWAGSIDLALVERYDAHAMIELGTGSRPSSDQPVFDVDEIISSLEPAFR